MKRFALAILFLVGLSVFVPATQASSHSYLRRSEFAHAVRVSLARHLLFGFHRSSIKTLVDSPLRDSHAPDGQTAAELALDPTAFAPAIVNSAQSGVEDNATADTHPFRIDHAVAYSASNRVTGYYQRADWMPTGSNDTAIFRYQGSIYTNTAAAAAAFQDGVSHTQTLSGSSAPSNCTSSLQVPCSLGGFVLADGTLVLYGVVQVNRCLVELGVEGDSAIFSAQQNALIQTSATILSAGFTAAQAICGTPTTLVPLTPGTQPTPVTTAPSSAPIVFKIDAVAVHKQLVQSPTKASFKTIKVGKVVYLTVYYTIQSAPTNAHLAITFTLISHGRIVATQAFPQKQIINAPSSDIEYVQLKFTKAGPYTFVARLTIGTQFQEGRVKFRIKK
jgi:hypothetical protein